MTPLFTSSARDEALGFLFGRIDYERAAVIPYGARDFKLDRMRTFLELLGRPAATLPIVHITGTKGKGSVAAMVAAMLTAAGYCTGLFSSPHLHEVEERIRIDGRPCAPEELVDLVAAVRPVVEAMDRGEPGGEGPGGPTYFELTTAMALVHFARRAVDAAVLEVGLGGRLDSTNVCQPRVAVITSVSFDHTRQLGNTLPEIAWEKAGIIKPGIPAISGVLDEEPRRVIEQVCEERGSRLVQLGRDFHFDYHPPLGLEAAPGYGRVDFWQEAVGRKERYEDLSLGLLGRHQAANAAVALAVVAELGAQGWNIPEAAVRRGLQEVSWPARVEVVSRRPTVVIDAAHNVASIAALLATLEESFSARQRVLVFATTRDKDARGMLELLLPRFDRVLLTRYWNNPRGVPAAELESVAAELGSGSAVACPDAATAWDQARALAGPEDLICVTGSFFLAAEMRQLLGVGGAEVGVQAQSP